MASSWLSISATFQLTIPPGMTPQFTSERPNVASSAAIAMSQAQTWVNAPPKQKPLTIAMVGAGKVRQFVPAPLVGRMLCPRPLLGVLGGFAKVKLEILTG